MANTATVVVRNSRITNNVIQPRDTYDGHELISPILKCQSCNKEWQQGAGAGLAISNYLKDAMPHVTVVRTVISANVNAAGKLIYSNQVDDGAGGGVGVSMGIVQLIDCDIGHNRAFFRCVTRDYPRGRDEVPGSLDHPVDSHGRPRPLGGRCISGPGKNNDASIGAGVMVEGFGLAVDVTLIGCDVHHNVR